MELEPRIIEQPERLLAGVGYELHVQTEAEPTMHVCLVGVAVEREPALPIEAFAKLVPGGQYAVFTQRIADGSFAGAFERVYAWLADSPYVAAQPFDLQRYDERFLGPNDPSSVFEVLVPLRPR